MVLMGTTIDIDIIINCDNAREMGYCLVHSHMKDALGLLQTEWQMQESVSAMMHVEGSHIQRFLI